MAVGGAVLNELDTAGLVTTGKLVVSIDGYLVGSACVLVKEFCELSSSVIPCACLGAEILNFSSMGSTASSPPGAGSLLPPPQAAMANTIASANKITKIFFISIFLLCKKTIVIFCDTDIQSNIRANAFWR